MKETHYHQLLLIIEDMADRVRLFEEHSSFQFTEVKTKNLLMEFLNTQSLLKQIILENNKILAPLEIGQAPDRAITVEKKIFSESKVRENAIRLLKSLPSHGSFSSSKISEIGFSSKEGFWTDLLHKELRVKLGSENFESKSIRVSQVLDYIENKQIEARVIDANLSQKVLVRLRKDP